MALSHLETTVYRGLLSIVGSVRGFSLPERFSTCGSGVPSITSTAYFALLKFRIAVGTLCGRFLILVLEAPPYGSGRGRSTDECARSLR